MSNMKKFENTKHPEIPTVTVRKNGTTCINTKAIEEFKLTEFQAATLYYDQRESLIGIKPIKENKDLIAFRLSKEKGRASTISYLAPF